MSGSSESLEELGILVADLCDGELDADRAARLEQLVGESADSRRFFIEYLELHGELSWDHAGQGLRSKVWEREHAPEHPEEGEGDSPSQASGVPSTIIRRASQPQKILLVITAAAVAFLVVLLGWWTEPGNQRPAALPGPTAETVATLSGTDDALWQSPASPAEGQPLAAGQSLRLRQGLAEITFASGANAILQGPASFRLADANAGELDAGRLTARVPSRASGFSVRTPGAVVVDRGTEFGVFVQPGGQSEVHVFAGAVDVRPTDNTGPRRLRAGEAVRVTQSGSQKMAMVPIALAEQDFFRRLPAHGSAASQGTTVADFRRLVDSQPSLIHHYTFEGTTRAGKCRDSRGDLHLAEVVMADGRGGGNMDYSAEGVDPTTNAIEPFRAAVGGNTSGASLQSESPFQPPAAMTVELLVTFDGSIRAETDAVAAAIATRHDQRDCGFLVAAVADGQVVYLMDGDAAWGQSDLVLQPGQWYYLAATFQSEASRTTVNMLAANLSRGERSLRQVVREHIVPGVPATSRLGIGKGFDGTTAHAYPWAGALDELAIYAAVLDRPTLQTHLEAIAGPPHSKESRAK